MPRNLPVYNNALGDFLKFPGRAEQTYNDVLEQVYPLRADTNSLATFCNNYLNKGGDAPFFEPAAPWVLMQVCNYGKMALRSENIGWVSQHELAFGFPVAWYETRGGKFIDWAMVYPFIYVDNPLSMSLGRQVYGWPKAGIEIKTSRPSLEPNVRCLASIDLGQGPERDGVSPYGGTRFLEVLQYQALLTGGSGGATLYSLPARAMSGYLSAASGMLDAFNRMVAGYQDRLSAYTKPDPRGAPESIAKLLLDLAGESLTLTGQAQRWYDYIDAFLSAALSMTLAQERALGMPIGSEAIERARRNSGGKVRIITLKQFRDAQVPEESCYTAIVASTMGFSQPTDGALLLSDPLSPDPSGGVAIRLRNDLSRAPDGRGGHSDQSIVGSLGLEFQNVEHDGNRSIHTLRPVVPFWVKLNMSYDAAEYQCWRTRYTSWSIDRKPQNARPGASPARAAAGADVSPLRYIPWGSGASLEVRGPMKSANFGLRVYGLEADGQKLQDLCDRYLRHQDSRRSKIYDFTVSPLPEAMLTEPKKGVYYVLMLVSSFDAMSGTGQAPEHRNLHDRVLTFAIPATCTNSGQNARRVLIPVYTFVEQDWDFLTEYEVYGRVAFKALLQSPPDTWVEKSKGKHELLKVYTTVVTREKQEPQSARFLPLIEVWEAASSAQGTTTKLANGGGKLKDAYLTLLGLPTVRQVPPQPVAMRAIALKQVRDAIEPGKACYQAFVGVKRTIGEGWKWRDDQQQEARPLEVRFYTYPGISIVATLGIHDDAPRVQVSVNGETHFQHLVHTSPGIVLSGQMVEEAAENLCWTLEENDWQDDPQAAKRFFL